MFGYHSDYIDDPHQHQALAGKLAQSLRLHSGVIGQFLSIKADINGLYAGRRPAAVNTDGHVVTVQSYKMHMVSPNWLSLLQDFRT